MRRRQFIGAAGLGALLGGVEAPAARGAMDSQTIRQFKRALAGGVLVPGDAEYPARAGDFNLRVGGAPAVIALCAGPADASLRVHWAEANGVRISMRSGGRSYEGFLTGPGIVIDVGLSSV